MATESAASIDNRIYDWTVHQWGKSTLTDTFFMVVAEWTPMVMLAVIFLATTGYAQRIGTASSAHIAAGIAVASAILARLVNEPITRLTARPRPFQENFIQPLLRHDEGESFPSNHATGAFALACGFVSIPEYFYVLLVLALLLSVSRVYTGLHYLTDVLTGAVNGAVISLFVGFVFHSVYR